eukprot:359586-Chlamydomonas_euryale.AAC.28
MATQAEHGNTGGTWQHGRNMATQAEHGNTGGTWQHKRNMATQAEHGNTGGTWQHKRNMATKGCSGGEGGGTRALLTVAATRGTAWAAPATQCDSHGGKGAFVTEVTKGGFSRMAVVKGPSPPCPHGSGEKGITP